MLTLNQVEEIDKIDKSLNSGDSSKGSKTKVKKFDLFDTERNSKVRNDFRFNEEELGLEIEYAKAGKDNPEKVLRRMSIALESQSMRSSNRSSKNRTPSPRKSRFAGKIDSVETSFDANPYQINGRPSKISKFGSSKFVETQKAKQGSKKSRFNIGSEQEVGQQEQEDEDEELCIICYSNPQNTVCMPCGHGSTCITCANTFVGETGQCCICREKVTQMIEIDLSEKNNSCFKVKKAYIFMDEEPKKTEDQ